MKKVFLENSQENTCVRVSFNKVAGQRFVTLLLKKRRQRSATLLKKRLQHRCYPANFAKFFTEHLFLQKTSGDSLRLSESFYVDHCQKSSNFQELSRL